jgi:diadenosine tetraphosphatase ApaH/serine/threonine PP2A family protein phosphatase
MRYLALSDIHANIDALDAVLAAASTDGFDRVLCLGDIVGYGADPNGVIDRIRQATPVAFVRGNHDRVGAGLDDAEGFNPVAREGAIWTQRSLTAENREYLTRLVAGPVFVDDLIEICHGSPFDEDAYVFDALDSLNALRAARRPLCLFGHTHAPAAVTLSRDELGYQSTEAGSVLRIREHTRYLVNVGSVGQPRDGDPRAGFGIVDTERREMRFYRVAYPVERAQARIREAGLPDALAERLAVGR